MPLQQWIAELNAASTEVEIVNVVNGFVRQVRRTSNVPEQCLPAAPGTVDEIRKAASALTRCSIDGHNPADREAYQQLLVFLSLAVDRINMLETRGLLMPLINSLGIRNPGGMPAAG